MAINPLNTVPNVIFILNITFIPSAAPPTFPILKANPPRATKKLLNSLIQVLFYLLYLDL